MFVVLPAGILVLVFVERFFARRVVKRSGRNATASFAATRGLRLLAVALMFALIAAADVPWWLRVLTGLVVVAGGFAGVAYLWGAYKAFKGPVTDDSEPTSSPPA